MKHKIIPAILEEDFNEIKSKISLIKDQTDLVQLDICDGRFVKVKTWPFTDLNGEFEKIKSQIKLVEADLLDAHSLYSIIEEIKPDFIFHLAATFERTEEDLNFWQLNYQNELKLNHLTFDAAKECTNLQKFIFASSYLIYDPKLYLVKDSKQTTAPLKETDNINPRNLCGAAKLYAEKELDKKTQQSNNKSIISLLSKSPKEVQQEVIKILQEKFNLWVSCRIKKVIFIISKLKNKIIELEVLSSF